MRTIRNDVVIPTNPPPRISKTPKPPIIVLDIMFAIPNGKTRKGRCMIKNILLWQSLFEIA